MIDMPFILFGTFLFFTTFTIMSFMIARNGNEQRNLQHRIDRVSNGIFLQPEDSRPGWLEELKKYKNSFSKSLVVLNIDLNRAQDYPLPWHLTLIFILVFSRIIILFVGIFFHGPVIIFWPLFTLFISRWIFGIFHRRRASALFQQFPDALGTIVRCVRVGIPVQETLRIVSRDMPEPTAQEFSRLADKVAIGVPLELALHELADRCHLAEYKFFATALSLQARTGGPLAQTLDTLADVIRKRVAMKARGYALASEARTSALILGILPIFAGVAIWVLQPSYIDALFNDPVGHEIFGGAVFLLGLGSFIMRAIIQRNLS